MNQDPGLIGPPTAWPLCLSIMQPWAYFIVNGHKPVENRDWKDWNPGLQQRGPILIHAGKKMDPDFDEIMRWVIEDLKIEVPHSVRAGNLPRGGIVGRAVITAMVRAHPSPWFCGPQAFVLAQAEPIDFIPFKGKLGFFPGPLGA